jgi:hypothetical protein
MRWRKKEDEPEREPMLEERVGPWLLVVYAPAESGGLYYARVRHMPGLEQLMGFGTSSSAALVSAAAKLGYEPEPS